MGLFSNFIKPSLAINMLRSVLKKQIGKDVFFFSLVYNSNLSTLEFIVDGKRYNFTDEKIKGLIESTSKARLKKNQTLDHLIANVDDKNNCDAKLYYSEMNSSGISVKQFVTFKF